MDEPDSPAGVVARDRSADGIRGIDQAGESELGLRRGELGLVELQVPPPQ